MNRVIHSLPRVGIALVALCLPFTSSPLVGKLSGSTMVAPLAMLPMGGMLVFWLLPYFLRKGALPPQSKPLLLFLAAALISCLAALAISFPAYKDQTPLHREFEALSTLAVGLGFFLLLSAWLGDTDKLCFFLRWLNWGGAAITAWSLLQAAFWYKTGSYPDWMGNFQEKLVMGELLFPNRVNGFAYEPSWLANQLNMLYLPYWIAASITGFSAHRLRLWKVHVEHLLLAGGLATLFLTSSRVGWLAILLVAAYLILMLDLQFVRRAEHKLLARFKQLDRWKLAIRRWFVAASMIALVIFFALMVLGAGFVLSKIDIRMRRTFDFATIRERSFQDYANQLQFAERIEFWEAGWDVFNDYPVLGVGLGNSGFFFPQKMSTFGWSLTEVRMVIYQWDVIPNIKSLWVRLLAETGIVGFALFLGWLYLLWKSGRFLVAQKSPLLRTVGWAGVFTLIGLLTEGFSVDTFALPYYWVSFAMLAAGSDLAVRALTGKREGV